MKKIIAASILVLNLTMQSAYACTIFSLYPNGQHWIGRTYDWSFGHGTVFTNKRNVTKTALRLLPTDVPSTWTSKYGSVTFNQFGREFPNGGMNEEGLVIDALELLTSIYPAADSKPSFNELQFVQYVLDNFKTVSDLKTHLETIRLAPVGSKLHYFVCDVKKCMTIEYIGGKLVTHDSENLSISGLANHTYEQSVSYAKNFVTFGGEAPVVLNSKDSLDRFVRSNYNAKFIADYDNQVAAVFNFLQDVGTANNRWQIIYNQDEKTIHFRTQTRFAEQKKIELSAFDFSCQAPVRQLDMDSTLSGDVSGSFSDFNSQLNLEMIQKSVKLQKLPEALAGRLSIYPNETRCN